MDPLTQRMLDGIKSRMERAGSAAEAEAAAAAMQRMILKHNLDAADLQGLGKERKEEYISRYIQLGPKGSSGLQWRINLAYTIGEMNFCAFIREGFHGGTGWMVGQASNVDAAEQMFKSIADANERLVTLEWYSFRNSYEYIRAGQPSSVSWKNSFKHGFVAGVHTRMKNERVAMSKELEAGKISALVVVKDAELKQAVAEKIGRTVKSGASQPNNHNGFMRGHERGMAHETRGRIGS